MHIDKNNELHKRVGGLPLCWSFGELCHTLHQKRFVKFVHNFLEKLIQLSKYALQNHMIQSGVDPLNYFCPKED